jgi:hypothetical protein
VSGKIKNSRAIKICLTFTKPLLYELEFKLLLRRINNKIQENSVGCYRRLSFYQSEINGIEHDIIAKKAFLIGHNGA